MVLVPSLFIIEKITSTINGEETLNLDGDVIDDEDSGDDGDADVDSRLVEGGVSSLYQMEAWEPAQPDMDICSVSKAHLICI